MPIVIRYTGEPYQTERAINHALNRDWRAVVMYAEAGGTIRIAPCGGDLFGDDVLVLTAGQQLTISDNGEPRVEDAWPDDINVEAWTQDQVSGR